MAGPRRLEPNGQKGNAMILIGNGVLITQNASCPVIHDGCVAVDGTTIVISHN